MDILSQQPVNVENNLNPLQCELAPIVVPKSVNVENNLNPLNALISYFREIMQIKWSKNVEKAPDLPTGFRHASTLADVKTCFSEDNNTYRKEQAKQAEHSMDFEKQRLRKKKERGYW